MPLRDGFFSTATQTSCCNRIQRSNRVRLLVVSTHDFPDRCDAGCAQRANKQLYCTMLEQQGKAKPANNNKNYSKRRPIKTQITTIINKVSKRHVRAQSADTTNKGKSWTNDYIKTIFRCLDNYTAKHTDIDVFFAPPFFFSRKH